MWPITIECTPLITPIERRMRSEILRNALLEIPCGSVLWRHLQWSRFHWPVKIHRFCSRSRRLISGFSAWLRRRCHLRDDEDLCAVVPTMGASAPKFGSVKKNSVQIRWMNDRGFRRSPFLPIPRRFKKAIKDWRGRTGQLSPNKRLPGKSRSGIAPFGRTEWLTPLLIETAQTIREIWRTLIGRSLMPWSRNLNQTAMSSHSSNAWNQSKVRNCKIVVNIWNIADIHLKTVGWYQLPNWPHRLWNCAEFVELELSKSSGNSRSEDWAIVLVRNIPRTRLPSLWNGHRTRKLLSIASQPVTFNQSSALLDPPPLSSIEPPLHCVKEDRSTNV